MVQGRGGAAALPAAARNDHFVFDLKNGLRVWLSEAVKRSEITAKDAQDAIRNIDASKAADVTEDQLKLWLGPIKDSFGMVKLGQKLVIDFNKWWGVRVYFKPGTKGDLVIIKGWPNGRKLLSATQYRVDNIKIMELQIGKPGIQAAAKESARFGVVLIVAIDFVQFVRDRNFAHLLGSLTVDVPSVMLASAIGAAAGTFAAGAGAGILAIGSFALGPALVAFAVGALAGYALYRLDQHFGLTEKVTAAYERALDKLARWWLQLGNDAHRKWNDFINSGAIQDMEKGFGGMAARLGQGDNALYMLESII